MGGECSTFLNEASSGWLGLRGTWPLQWVRSPLDHADLRLLPRRADSSTEITMTPQPTEAEIQFILDAIAEYLTVKVRSPLRAIRYTFLTGC